MKEMKKGLKFLRWFQGDDSISLFKTKVQNQVFFFYFKKLSLDPCKRADLFLSLDILFFLILEAMISETLNK